VINGEGLVGKVTQVASDGAQVSLITDSSMGVSSRIGTTNATGIVQPRSANPTTCCSSTACQHAREPGEYVVTSGTV